jgi:hypothetical protein
LKGYPRRNIVVGGTLSGRWIEREEKNEEQKGQFEPQSVNLREFNGVSITLEETSNIIVSIIFIAYNNLPVRNNTWSSQNSNLNSKQQAN